jgi:hypothetical protein
VLHRSESLPRSTFFLLSKLFQLNNVCDESLVDDLAYRLSRFLIFLFVSQHSCSIPSIQDSCLKKQTLTFLWYSCRQKLGWRGKRCLTRQDSCVLEFLPDSFFSWNSCLIPFSCISCLLLFFLKFLPDFFFFLEFDVFIIKKNNKLLKVIYLHKNAGRKMIKLFNLHKK